ncbi:acetyl-CoA carboxylase biotin carboxylase subunit [Dongia sedimenti]|uniref:propionyl-CoA carboxylase n=1 Tax=Dongia sedimenti TaxID=3064282 RepID=A0ABU0YFU7_9PROT|nr:acetyl/propionyl/methylcrotonyl-CoA carboxylase subunit alpha [Rhodospirillaceae bacterium R-7]
MFKKILIANRGEIACRVIRTARAMGIQTVAVYSEADADALHVREADEAVAIGQAAAAESYLKIEKIIDACKQTGADAVHPGYGFLSENVKFAEALKKAKIAFIGPDPHAVQAMGDKIESKKLAKEAGVSMVPGFLDVIKDAEHCVKVSREIGYPVMIKASAGGGGKGMRIAHDDDEAREGFKSASNEARSSFADERVFAEKYIEQPRHIEIQILADGHGHCLYLGERECSIQRRHQKVIEEAPSPFLDEKTRTAMGEQAVALAKAVKYKSAGTVEFIVDQKRNFYFLEMNTRLQVEHPVTELVTGLDLVEQMIRVAAGEKLKLRQSDVRLKGWALEARVYAEDPFRNFLPSTGRLIRYAEPPEGPSVRVDSGVYEGAEISMFYDPMIAKLVTYGADRPAAVAAMLEALDAFYIRGLSHNIPFLSALAAHPRFQAGRLSTAFIAEEFPDGFHGVTPDPDATADLVAVMATVHHLYERRAHARQPHFQAKGSKVGGDWVVKLGGAAHAVSVVETAGGFAVVGGSSSREVISNWRLGDPLYQGRIDGRPITVQIDRNGVGYRVSHGGATLKTVVLNTRAAELDTFMPEKVPPDMSRFLLSPMPGLLVSLAVHPDEEVKAGQTLAVVEAMKMENILKAERDGKVAKLHAKPGDSLAVDQVILEFA